MDAKMHFPWFRYVSVMELHNDGIYLLDFNGLSK
jgi:hypothetical protein